MTYGRKGLYSRLPFLGDVENKFFLSLEIHYRQYPSKTAILPFPRASKPRKCLLSGWLHRHISLSAFFIASFACQKQSLPRMALAAPQSAAPCFQRAAAFKP